MPTHFKVLNDDGTPYHGGNGRWSLPTDDGPGDWMPPVVGALKPCANGYHLTTADHLVAWLGPALYLAEYQGEMIEAGDKIVVREARLVRRLDAWTKRTARLFACDCAGRAVPLYEQRYPTDRRPRDAIVTARHYANGEATAKELAAAAAAAAAAADATAAAAAAAAAASAARAAAAAYGAAYAAYAARAAAAAYPAAAAAAADATAAVAAYPAAAAAYAAYAAEHAWQTDHLLTLLGVAS